MKHATIDVQRRMALSAAPVLALVSATMSAVAALRDVPLGALK